MLSNIKIWFGVVVLIGAVVGCHLNGETQEPSSTPKPEITQIKDSQYFGFNLIYTEPPYAYGKKEWDDYYLVLDDFIKHAKELDVNWVRWYFHLSRIEPKPEQFRSLKETHKALDMLRQNNINIMAIIIEMPEWNSEIPEGEEWRGEPMFPPKDFSAFQNSIKVIVSEFKDKIRYWQIWEEPNVMLEGWADDEQRVKTYAKMLKLGCDAIKEIDPNLQIVLGSIHPPIHIYETDWLGYVRKLLRELEKPEYGNKPMFDILAINAYHSPYHPKEKNPKTGLDFGQMVDTLKQEFDKSRKYRDKEMWITILSWPAIGNRDQPDEMMVSEENQARYIEIVADILFEREYIERVFWFELWDSTQIFPRIPKFEFHGGLMRYDKKKDTFVPKSSYEAFKKVVQKQKNTVGPMIKANGQHDCVKKQPDAGWLAEKPGKGSAGKGVSP